MSNIEIASNAYITLEYLPDRNLLKHTIHQPVSEAPKMFMDVLNAGVEAFIEHDACKWLSDDRKNGPLSDEILEWAMSEWYDKAIGAGWKYWANVVPEEVKAAGTLLPVIKQLSSMGLRMQVFTSVESAIEWLDSIPES